MSEVNTLIMNRYLRSSGMILLLLAFYSPLVGFSLLAYEVS